MSAKINTPTTCDVRSVIRFLNARGHNAAEIYCQLCESYGSITMSEGKVRQWCHKFRKDHSNVHDEERSGRPSIWTDNLTEYVNAKVRENRSFMISDFCINFPSKTTIFRTGTDTPGYHKLCVQWVPEMLTSAYKDQRLTSAHAFLVHFHR